MFGLARSFAYRKRVVDRLVICIHIEEGWCKDTPLGKSFFYGALFPRVSESESGSVSPFRRSL